MKIAILISGEYRTFKYCRPSMSYLDDSRVDVYFSTWDKTTYASPKINLNKVENVTKEQIIADCGFNPVEIIIEDTESFNEVKYNSRMIHRWNTGFKMIVDSGIEYDYVIITRPDIYYEGPLDLNHLYKFNDHLGVIWANSLIEGKLADVTMVSSFKIIKNIFGQLNVDEWKKSNEYNWHIWWHDYCKSKVSIKRLDDSYGRIAFYRCITPRDISDYQTIFGYHQDWRDLQILHQSDLRGRDSQLIHWPREIVDGAERKWADGHFEKFKHNGKDNP
jgi:hypothetical protein